MDTRTVLDDLGGEDVVADPDVHAVHALEARGQEVHLSDGVSLAVAARGHQPHSQVKLILDLHVDAVSDVVRVLDEEEDAREQDLLHR